MFASQGTKSDHYPSWMRNLRSFKSNSASKEFDKAQHSAWLLKIVILITLIDMIATGLVVPTIPYYAQRLDLNSSAQGSLMSLYGILQLAGSPILGRLSDMYGRKVVLMMSIMGTFVSYSLLIYAEDLSIFFVSRIIVGLLKNTETSCYSVITDTSAPAARVKRMAYVGSAIGFGFILGPAVSGLLTTRFSLETPAYVSAVMILCNALLTFLLLPETRHFSRSSSASVHSSSTTSSSSSASHLSTIMTDSGENDSDDHDTQNIAPDLASLNDEVLDELGSPIDLLSNSSDLIQRDGLNKLPIIRDDEAPEMRKFPRGELTEGDARSNSEATNALHMSGSTQSSMSFWNLMMKPSPLRNLVWFYFGTSMAVMIFQGSSVILFQQLGLPVQATSWIISYSGLLTVISSFVIHWLTSRYSEPQLMRDSLLIVALTLLGTIGALAHESTTIAGLLIGFVPFTLGARILKNCLLGAVTRQAPSSQTGTIIGVLNSLESLCRAMSPLIRGLLMDAFAAGPALLSALLCLGYYAWILRNPISIRDG